MKKIILSILYLIPVILLIGFVANFSVNVPVDDEWRLASFFEKIAAGNVTFNDFWALHSNHRIVFPKIIIAALAFASQWNINYQLYLSICLAVITSIALYQLSSIQVKSPDNLWHLANILTGIFIFSLVQYENWLWGFQLAWFLVNLCFIGAVCALVSHGKFSPETAFPNYMKHGRDTAMPCPYPIANAAAEDAALSHSYPIYIKISLAALCCFIASFSLAQGLLSWLAAIPAVVSLEGKATQKIKITIVWIMLFLATCTAYFINYQPSRKTNIIALLNKPLAVIDYFLSLLGSPIVRSPGFSAFAGLVILAVFGFFVVHFSSIIASELKHFSDNIIASSSATIEREDASNSAISSFLALAEGKKFTITKREEEGSSDNAIVSSLAITESDRFLPIEIAESNAGMAVPWLSIGLFSILSSLLIAVGRAEFGAIQAIESSRYTTNSILLLIAVLQLGMLFVGETKTTLKRNYKFIYWGFSGMLIAAIILNSQQAFAQARSAFIYKQGAQDCLQLINYLEQSEFFNNSPESCLRVLSKKTWLVREGAASIDKIGWRNFAKKLEFVANNKQVYGYLDKPETGGNLTVKKNATVKVAGWAILPENVPQPNIVLLSVGDKQSFFANAYINLDSPDIAKTLKSESYKNARWAADLPAHNLPIGPTEIKAWVYNPVDGKFVKLRGGARLIVEDGE